MRTRQSSERRARKLRPPSRAPSDCARDGSPRPRGRWRATSSRSWAFRRSSDATSWRRRACGTAAQRPSSPTVLDAALRRGRLRGRHDHRTQRRPDGDRGRAAGRVVAGTTAVTIPLLSAVSVDCSALRSHWPWRWSRGSSWVPCPPSRWPAPARPRRSTTRAAGPARESAAPPRERRSSWSRCPRARPPVGGGLLLRSFVNVLDVDLGFEPEGAAAWRVDTNRSFERARARRRLRRPPRPSRRSRRDRGRPQPSPPRLGRNRSGGWRRGGLLRARGLGAVYRGRLVTTARSRPWRSPSSLARWSARRIARAHRVG